MDAAAKRRPRIGNGWGDVKKARPHQYSPRRGESIEKNSWLNMDAQDYQRGRLLMDLLGCDDFTG